MTTFSPIAGPKENSSTSRIGPGHDKRTLTRESAIHYYNSRDLYAFDKQSKNTPLRMWPPPAD